MRLNTWIHSHLCKKMTHTYQQLHKFNPNRMMVVVMVMLMVVVMVVMVVMVMVELEKKEEIQEGDGWNWKARKSLGERGNRRGGGTPAH